MKNGRKLISARGWLAVSLCMLLVISSLVHPLVNFASERKPIVRSHSTQHLNAQEKKVTPVPPERGIPTGLILPNLDDVRNRPRQEPKAPSPIESTMRSRRKAEKAKPKKKSHHAMRSETEPRTIVSGIKRSDPFEPQSGTPSFTDDPLNPLGQPKTDIKALHITELRYWINALRNRRGYGNYSWVKPTASGGAINSSVLISWEPIDEMRTALNEALGAPAGGYAQGLGPGENIQAAHIQELRNRVITEWGSSLADQLVPGRVDLFNQSGNQIEARDCEWGIPLVSLPGRAGLDLGISLSYSSLVWSKAGSTISFDDDRGDPSPGFKLGFLRFRAATLTRR